MWGEFEVCARGLLIVTRRIDRVGSRQGPSADTCLHQTIMCNVLEL